MAARRRSVLAKRFDLRGTAEPTSCIANTTARIRRGRSRVSMGPRRERTAVRQRVTLIKHPSPLAAAIVERQSVHGHKVCLGEASQPDRCATFPLLPLRHVARAALEPMAWRSHDAPVMALTLADIRRIASDVAQHQHPGLDVVGVTRREGSSSSAEVILCMRDCEFEPCRLVIGVSRRVSERECRNAVRIYIRGHLARTAMKSDGA
jgi:hypothetical protein